MRLSPKGRKAFSRYGRYASEDHRGRRCPGQRLFMNGSTIHFPFFCLITLYHKVLYGRKAMRRRLLLILPALQQLHNYEFRLIKYSRFPPLSLLTIAGLTPEDRWGNHRPRRAYRVVGGGRRRRFGRHSNVHLLLPAAPMNWRGVGGSVGRRWSSAGCIRPAFRTRPPLTPTPSSWVRPSPSGKRCSTISNAAHSNRSTRGGATDRPLWSRYRVGI